MHLIDTHCHLDFPVFNHDRELVIQRAKNHGVQQIILPAVEQANWSRIQNLCAGRTELLPAYGLHPVWEPTHTDADIEALHAWVHEHQPIAIGECGLDGIVSNSDFERQQRIFEAHIQLACDMGLPLIIHARKATEAVMLMLKRYPKARGVIHGYSGSLQQAMQLIDMGLYIGIGTVITQPRATRMQRIAQTLPIERIMLESDAPDQPPHGFDSTRNEPWVVSQVLEQLAQLKQLSSEVLSFQVMSNTTKLF